MSVCPYCETAVSPEFISEQGGAVVACLACMNPFMLSSSEDAVAARPLPRHKDLRVTSPPGSLGGELLAAAPEAIKNLPMLPKVGLRLMNILNTPDISISEIVQIIQQDPVIALKVMKLANSVMFGGLQEVKELNTACARLGLKTIANAVQAAGASRVFSVENESLHGMMQALWRHSIAAAHCSGKLADMLAAPNSAMLFMAGLVQGVGGVALLDIFASTRSELLLDALKNPRLFQQLLQGFAPIIGLHVMQHWKMPAEFRAATYCRNQPDVAPGEELLFMTHLVALAVLIAEAEGYGMCTMEGSEDAAPPALATHPSARFLNLTDMKIAALRVDLQDELERLLSSLA